MGSRGPLPKSAARRRLEGDSSHRAPKPAKKDLTPIKTTPDFLDAAARREWDRLKTELVPLGLWTVTNQGTLECICMAYSKWQAAEGDILAYKDRMAAALKAQPPLIKPQGKAEPEVSDKDRDQLRDLMDAAQKRSNAYMRYADSIRRLVESARSDPGRKPKRDSFFNGDH